MMGVDNVMRARNMSVSNVCVARRWFGITNPVINIGILGIPAYLRLETDIG